MFEGLFRSFLYLFLCTVLTSIFDRFLVQLGANLAPTWLSKSTKIQSKFDVKSICMLTSISDTFFIGFWTYVDVAEGSKSLKNQRFLKVFDIFTLCSSTSSWTRFGAQIWSIFGAKLDPSWIKNWSKNQCKNMIDFETDFWSILDQLGSNFGPNLVPSWT